MKCLPSNKLPHAHGNILHDWHAEIIAIRAFNRYLLDQCLLISTPPYPTSPFIRQLTSQDHAKSPSEQQPFTIRDHVSIHMYCSEAPCGDASMELTMALQPDATPWTSAPPTLQTAIPSPSLEPTTLSLRGRSNFSHLGIVRAKPSRPDAPPTHSKSCTDKLCLKQATSLLSSTTSLLMSPRNAYIKTLVLPESQLVAGACERAFAPTGRLKELNAGGWTGGYALNPFTVQPTSREFTWTRRARPAAEKAVPSNLSAVWTPNWQETLIGGVLQGRKQTDPRGASRISRRGMWMEAIRLAGQLGIPAVLDVLRKKTYGDTKTGEEVESRERVKSDVRRVLGGWVVNAGDDDFHISDLNSTSPP
ncbi:tRNA-specific adenosine deaminase [Decorospora gaudefroyi]|uniref:tRNA-specific adenosine deaminase n=1 Tax=Decorospora gaudefroyi TaxID=184978 RepID=A0A6A5JZC6_9PLEO|nr:tRNA-specific adenosine deaminase [Decorospora gaudefroyi]